MPREHLHCDARQNGWWKELQQAFSMRNHDKISVTDICKRSCFESKNDNSTVRVVCKWPIAAVILGKCSSICWVWVRATRNTDEAVTSLECGQKKGMDETGRGGRLG